MCRVCVCAGVHAHSYFRIRGSVQGGTQKYVIDLTQSLGQGQRLSSDALTAKQKETVAFSQVPLFWRPASPQLLSEGEVVRDLSLGLGRGCRMTACLPMPTPDASVIIQPPIWFAQGCHRTDKGAGTECNGIQ